LNFARFKGSTSMSERIDGSGEDAFPTGGRDGAVVFSGMAGNVEGHPAGELNSRMFDDSHLHSFRENRLFQPIRPGRMRIEKLREYSNKLNTQWNTQS
jgi:hypothetical protein